MSNDERERVRRIQENQLKSREQGKSKVNKYDWVQKPDPNQRALVLDLIDVFPMTYKGAAIGSILGLIVAILMKIANPEAAMLGLGVILVLGIVGWVLGMLVK